MWGIIRSISFSRNDEAVLRQGSFSRRGRVVTQVNLRRGKLPFPSLSGYYVLDNISTLSYYSDMSFTWIAIWGFLLLGATLGLAQNDSRLSAERSFTITLPAPPDQAFLAFGPVEEQKWAPEWRPTFVYQEGPEGHPSFAVFTVVKAREQATWVMSHYDLSGRAVQYVNTVPGKIMTVINIACQAAEPGQTRATVTYRRTALAADAIPAVEEFAREFAAQGPHWERAINEYLRGKKRPAAAGKD